MWTAQVTDVREQEHIEPFDLKRKKTSWEGHELVRRYYNGVHMHWYNIG